MNKITAFEKSGDYMNYIEVKHLTTGYDGIPLTKHINFVVEKGDYLCIVGEEYTYEDSASSYSTCKG